MAPEIVQPEGWRPPRGYSNGILAPAGARLLFIAGQVAWDEDQRLVGGDDLAAQFRRALANVVAVAEAAGGGAEHLVQLTVFVTDRRRYLACTRELGGVWRELAGRHYPAMALVEVSALLEAGALVEIQAIAALPLAGDGG